MDRQELRRMIENVWQNSRYYGDMLFTAIIQFIDKSCSISL